MAKSLIESIGNTPLVDVALDSQNVILGKLEGNNPGGSVKDRAALRMIEDAERENLIKNGDTLIDLQMSNPFSTTTVIDLKFDIIIINSQLSISRNEVNFWLPIT